MKSVRMEEEMELYEGGFLCGYKATSKRSQNYQMQP